MPLYIHFSHTLDLHNGYYTACRYIHSAAKHGAGIYRESAGRADTNE